MDPALLITAMQRAHYDWLLLMKKVGPDNLATRARRRRLEVILDSCAPKAPTMESRA